MKVLSLKEVADLLGISTKAATRILNIPGCPVLPRTKGQTFRVPEEAFRTWFANYGKEVRRGCKDIKALTHYKDGKFIDYVIECPRCHFRADGFKQKSYVIKIWNSPDFAVKEQVK